MNSNIAQTGVILLAHGSRDPLWSKPMESIADRVRRKQPEIRVLCAYLEMMQPNLADCAAKLIAAGITSIRILPLFLGLGKHVKEDLPELINSLRQNHPGVSFRLLPVAGEDVRVLQLLADIVLDPS
jgi:sirohydrochlorin cobaltochelatase